MRAKGAFLCFLSVLYVFCFCYLAEVSGAIPGSLCTDIHPSIIIRPGEFS